MNKRPEPKTDGGGDLTSGKGSKGSGRRIASRERRYIGLEVLKKNDERESDEWRGSPWRYYEDRSRADEAAYASGDGSIHTSSPNSDDLISDGAGNTGNP